MPASEYEDLQKRLTRLEENSFFESRQLEDLQKEIDILREDMENLSKKMLRLQDALLEANDLLANMSENRPPHELPPHYQVEK